MNAVEREEWAADACAAIIQGRNARYFVGQTLFWHGAKGFVEMEIAQVFDSHAVALVVRSYDPNFLPGQYVAFV